jgi:hypothetical protein
VDQVRVIDRFCEVPGEGALTDLLYSDPDPNIKAFGANPRAPGCTFGPNAVDQFLRANDLREMVVRCGATNYLLVMDGYTVQVLWGNKLAALAPAREREKAKRESKSPHPAASRRVVQVRPGLQLAGREPRRRQRAHHNEDRHRRPHRFSFSLIGSLFFPN